MEETLNVEKQFDQLCNHFLYVKAIQNSANDRKIRYEDLAHRVTFIKKKPERQVKIIRRKMQSENVEIEAIKVLEDIKTKIVKLCQDNTIQVPDFIK